MKSTLVCLVLLTSVVAPAAAADIAGRITAISMADGFVEISGVKVMARDARVKNAAGEHGTLGDLSVGETVDVEGSFTAPGLMRATEIESEPLENDEIEGAIDSVDESNRTVAVGGVTVKIPRDVRMKSKRGRPAGLGGLRKGQRLECEGTWTGNMRFTAKEVKVD